MGFNQYYSDSQSLFYWIGTTFTSLEQYQQNTNYDSTSAYGNPLFVNTGEFNFKLQSSSPCIDAGDPAYTPSTDELDFDKNPRKIGACVDRGAYETTQK